MLIETQKLVIGQSPAGGTLMDALNNLMANLVPYENARVVSLAVSPIKNPFGAGDLAIQVVAAIEHD